MQIIDRSLVDTRAQWFIDIDIDDALRYLRQRLAREMVCHSFQSIPISCRSPPICRSRLFYFQCASFLSTPLNRRNPAEAVALFCACSHSIMALHFHFNQRENFNFDSICFISMNSFGSSWANYSFSFLYKIIENAPMFPSKNENFIKAAMKCAKKKTRWHLIEVAENSTD